MSISFSGLATGLDTTAVIEALMQVERQPIARLEADKNYFNSRLTALTEFNSKLTAFLADVEAFDSSSELQPKTASLSSDDFISATASETAAAGSYQIKAQQLAQVQKDVSIGGYASRSDSVFHNGTLTIAGTEITLDADESLDTIRDKINDVKGTTGVSATIINDGSTDGYRLVLSGEDASTSFIALVSGVTSDYADLDFGHSNNIINSVSGWYADDTAKNFKGGTITINGTDITIGNNSTLRNIRDDINTQEPTTGVSASIVFDAAQGYRLELDVTTAENIDVGVTGSTTKNGYAPLEFTDTPPVNTHTQDAQLASIEVDGITITGNNNTFKEAIDGLTITLNDADGGATTTTLTVSLDETALKNKISAFVSGYNEVISFIASQSTLGDSTIGILNADSGLSLIKRRLQTLLTTQIYGSGSYKALSELGLETQKDGTLKINDSTLTSAIQNNMDSVVKLLAGEGSGSTAVTGIAAKFQEYLDDLTDTSSGFLVGRKKSTENTLKRIDNNIERLELRLEKREETLIKKFTALEELISVMNTQSSYLSQQMDMLSNLWSRKK